MNESMKVGRVALAAAVLLFGCQRAEPVKPTATFESMNRKTLAATAAPASPGDQAEKMFYVSTTLFGGCASGLDALRAYWKQKGIELTPHELSVRHGMVGCQTDEAGMVQVTFYPPTLQTGGSITYLVDPRTMQVVRTTYGR
jgi:hypothetical protein